MKPLLVHGFAMAAVLAVIAASTPTPASDDGDTYRDVGRQVLIPNCPTIHCFRVLVPAVLEHLPGPSRPK